MIDSEGQVPQEKTSTAAKKRSRSPSGAIDRFVIDGMLTKGRYERVRSL